MIEQYLASSTLVWGKAITNLPTLRPNVWIGAAVLDVFLSHRMANRPPPHRTTYIPMSWVLKPDRPEEAEKTEFSKIMDIRSIRAGAIIFIALQHEHYFLVLFDYPGRRFITYGRKFNIEVEPVCRDRDWEVWNGPELWNRVGILCGLPDAPPPLDRQCVQWKQVSGKHALCMYCSLVFLVWERLWCRHSGSGRTSVRKGTSTSWHGGVSSYTMQAYHSATDLRRIHTGHQPDVFCMDATRPTWFGSIFQRGASERGHATSLGEWLGYLARYCRSRR